ncbi:uncharacterized protein LOC126366626 [Pectinophora gossypiella]|uniref:uncharacterized protein LOC126366626 n=1 Tax=Pectinophora gossypiella TaxID=13191 RepID=UPI00214EB3FA|nr:uncharacterized protein LOC126366626 [Pectinophora gossypiella]
MSQRLPSTKWLWCLLVLSAGPAWSPAGSVAVKAPPNTPATVEAQAKFFQDFFSVQLSPYKIEFGHVCEDPNTWEQRYEKKDFKNHRDMGKVRWGDKQGGYGEHYWDLNHAGHAGDHGNDDYSNDGDNGAYRVHDDESNDPYDEPSEHSPNFSDNYDPERASSYEETNRAKRAQPKLKEKKDDGREGKLRIKVQEESEEDSEEEEEEEEATTSAPRLRKKQKRHKPREKNYEEEPQDTKPPAETNQFESRRQSEPTQFSAYEQEPKAAKTNQYEPRKQPEQTQYTYDQQESKAAAKANQYEPRRQPVQPQYGSYDQQESKPVAKPNQFEPRRQPEQTHYVPYEAGAGVRQYHAPEAVAAASAPRLFLEPSTGHVVDRATGQAYILQPIVANFN